MSSCNSGNDPQNKTSQTQLTPEGGVYTLTNGVTLVVPAGAVDENTTIKVEYSEDLDESKGALPGDIYGQLNFSPEGLIFNKPVEVSMPLNQPAVGDSATIVYWVPDSARWYISDIGCVQNGKVTFYVDHFSDYAAEVNNWMSVFSVMDSYVGAATSEEAISDAVGRYLETELWEKMGIKDLHIATRVNMGGQAVNTCVQACGIYGFWAEVKDSVLVRQGGKMFKEESTCNAYTIIGIHTSYLSSHLYGLLKNGEKQTISDRLLEINYKPCEIGLQGAAKESKIEKGKTTEVTIHAHCGEEALADQLIQLQYSPELSCDVVNKKTDSNGEIKITVKGVEEGKGIVYAKAVSAVDADLVTEIQIPVKVGGGDTWEVEWRIPITKTATLKSVDKYNERIPELDMIRAYSYSGDTKSVSFDVVGSARIQYAGTQYIPEAQTDFPVMKGTVSVTIDPASITYNYPEWTSSWEEWKEIVLKYETLEKIAAKYKYHFTYEPHYILHPRENIGFERMTGLNGRVGLGLTGLEGEEYGPVMVDSTVYTSTLSGTAYYYTTDDARTKIIDTQTQAIQPEVVTAPAGIINQIYPSSILFNLEEGTFPLYNWSDNTTSYSATKDNVYYSGDIDFHTVFYTESYKPYRGTPDIETTETGIGTITIRRVEEDENE